MGTRSFLASGCFLDQGRKEGSQMSYLPLNPCEVVFPAAKQALTSNAFLFQRLCTLPPTPLALFQPQLICSSWGLRAGGRGPSGTGPCIPPTCIHSGCWVHDQTRIGLLSGSGVTEPQLASDWSRTGLWVTWREFSPILACGGPTPLHFFFLSFSFLCSLSCHPCDFCLS